MEVPRAMQDDDEHAGHRDDNGSLTHQLPHSGQTLLKAGSKAQGSRRVPDYPP